MVRSQHPGGREGGCISNPHNSGQINGDRKHEFFSPPNGWWFSKGSHPLNFKEILAPKVFFHGSPENLMSFPSSVRISGISRGRAPIFHLAGGILSVLEGAAALDAGASRIVAEAGVEEVMR